MDMINDVIRERAMNRLPIDWLLKQRIYHGYFAGGGLLRADAHDIDLFPAGDDAFYPENDNGLVMQTANARTYRNGSAVIQLCNYAHPSLQELVESFDFAHIKAGVEFHLEAGRHPIKEVYVSSDFIIAHATETSYFTGSAYPLSSLMRLVKYAKRDVFAGKSYLPVMFSVLDSILKRGFKDYADFKDQLDAVDLGYLENDFNREMLMRIFERLRRDK